MRAGKPLPGEDTPLTIAQIFADPKVGRNTFDTWRSVGSAPECIRLSSGQIRVCCHALDTWIASLRCVKDLGQFPGLLIRQRLLRRGILQGPRQGCGSRGSNGALAAPEVPG